MIPPGNRYRGFDACVQGFYSLSLHMHVFMSKESILSILYINRIYLLVLGCAASSFLLTGVWCSIVWLYYISSSMWLLTEILPFQQQQQGHPVGGFHVKIIWAPSLPDDSRLLKQYSQSHIEYSVKADTLILKFIGRRKQIEGGKYFLGRNSQRNILAIL